LRFHVRPSYDFLPRNETMPSDLTKWLIVTAIGVAGFLLGGGWPVKAYRRMGDLDLKDRLKPGFPTREEFDAHVQDDREWRERIMEDFVEPSRELTKAILQLTGAIADLKLSSERNKDEIKRISEQLAELVEHSLHRRASDPPANPP